MWNRQEYVYVLTHVPTGKKYVGRTENPKNREAAHIASLKRGKHPCKALQADCDLYGVDLEFKVVCKNGFGRQRFDEEKQMMVKLKTYDERYGYNTEDIAMRRFRIANGLPCKEYKKPSPKSDELIEGTVFGVVKHLCDYHGVSIHKLESDTGIKNGTVSKWINSNPSLANAVKIAKYFNVPVDVIADSMNFRRGKK